MNLELVNLSFELFIMWDREGIAKKHECFERHKTGGKKKKEKRRYGDWSVVSRWDNNRRKVE